MPDNTIQDQVNSSQQSPTLQGLIAMAGQSWQAMDAACLAETGTKGTPEHDAQTAAIERTRGRHFALVDEIANFHVQNPIDFAAKCAFLVQEFEEHKAIDDSFFQALVPDVVRLYGPRKFQSQPTPQVPIAGIRTTMHRAQRPFLYDAIALHERFEAANPALNDGSMDELPEALVAEKIAFEIPAILAKVNTYQELEDKAEFIHRHVYGHLVDIEDFRPDYPKYAGHHDLADWALLRDILKLAEKKPA